MAELESYLDKAMESFRKDAPNSATLKKLFINAVSDFACLFGEKFTVQCENAQEIHESMGAAAVVELCVDRNGVHFRNSKTSLFLTTVPFVEHMIEVLALNKVAVATPDGKSYTFSVSSSSALEHVVNSTIEAAKKHGKWVKAKHSQNSLDDPTLLKFSPGDIIEIIERKTNDDDWLRGRNQSLSVDETGWFKKDFVSFLLSKPVNITRRVPQQPDSVTSTPRSSMLDPLSNTSGNSPAQEESFESITLDWAVANFRPDEKKSHRGGIAGTIRKMTAANTFKEGVEVDIAKVKERLTFSRVAIHASHLKLAYDDERYAVEVFQSVMKFMGDYPSKETSVDLARSIIIRGMEQSILFKTEIYCQILRQLVNNPSPKSEAKGWSLLQLIARYFAPDPGMFACLMKWLHSLDIPSSANRANAADVIQSLYVTNNGCRMVYPSLDEVTYQELSRPLSITINFLDRSTKKLAVTACSLVGELLMQICRKLDITKKLDRFSLFYEVSGKFYMCRLEEFVLDVIYNSPESSLSSVKSVKSSVPHRIFFKKVIWSKSERTSNNNEINIMYSQMIELHLSAYHRSTLGECTSIAALQAKAANMETVGKDASYKEDAYRLLVPPSMWSTIKSDVWLNEIDKQMTKYAKLTAGEAKDEVLRISSSWPVYGSTLYHVTLPKCDKVLLPDDAILVLSPEHVMILNSGTKIPLATWPYLEISGWNHAPDRVNLKIGSLMGKSQTNLKACTLHGYEICYLIGIYVKAASWAI